MSIQTKTRDDETKTNVRMYIQYVINTRSKLIKNSKDDNVYTYNSLHYGNIAERGERQLLSIIKKTR